MVYYRKYRPQTISDLDSTEVRDSFTALFSIKIGPVTAGKTPYKASLDYSIPHAFLFTGPKGLGKTSAARIVAKVANCTTPEDKRKYGFEPCNTCDQCVSITNGTNIDVLEIDGASNRGIDEIRDLRERVRLAPSQAKKKVYIIDEVHMLTTEAFNALLKTIEEPPSHVMFMFCTTEPHKVPATILSRCFHISFKPATDEEIIHSLQRIVHGEKLFVEPAALSQIAHMADGGFRDAAKLLEEAVALSEGKKITLSFVEEKFHTQGVSGYIGSLLDALSQRNVKQGMGVIATVVEQGIDIKFFTSELIETLHAMMLAMVGVGEEKKPQQTFTLEDIQVLLSLSMDSALQMKSSLIAQLPLELLVIAWCGQEKSAPVATGSVGTSGKQTIETLLRKERNLKIQNFLHPKEKEEKKPQPVNDQADITTHTNGTEMLMENIIYKVKALNASVAGVLRGCTIAEMTDEALVFETAYKFHKERLEEVKTYAIIEKTVREVTGKPLKITVKLKK